MTDIIGFRTWGSNFHDTVRPECQERISSTTPSWVTVQNGIKLKAIEMHTVMIAHSVITVLVRMYRCIPSEGLGVVHAYSAVRVVGSLIEAHLPLVIKTIRLENSYKE